VKLTDGLLANFAVSAVAAIRRGAHHVLTRFSKKLDGAYLSHRASIDVPEAAEDLALELVAVELNSMVENAGVASRTLSIAVIEAWLDHKSAAGHQFKSQTAAMPPAVLKDVLRQGSARLRDKQGQTRTNGNPNPAQVISDRTITEVFYDTELDARAAAKSFSRLASYKREVGRVRLDQFRPRLTLGALLKVRKDLSGKASFKGIEGEYLLCVQPRCDSVRLKGAGYCSFPFQQAKYDKDRFNLIVNEEGHLAYQSIDLKPMNTLVLRFKPKKDDDSVCASKNEDGDYLFKDERGRVFQWMGDLVEMKAQRLASEIGANMHRVGVDEFEWLRLGTSKNKPEGPPKDEAEG
jgi:hypothetical protein